MIGILANVAMQYTNWSTRICLVPVSQVRDRTIGALPNTWVDTQSYSARLSNLPKRNPMQYSENIMVDRLIRLGIAPSPEMMDIDYRTPALLTTATPRPSQQRAPAWGVLPPRSAQTPSPTRSQRWRSPASSPDSPPPGGPSQPVTPAQSPTNMGPRSGLLPSALRPPPSALPSALLPGSGPGSRPSSAASGLATPSRVPLPQPSGFTPYGTPQRRRSSAEGSDTPMRDA